MLRPLWAGLFFAPFTPRFIPRQSPARMRGTSSIIFFSVGWRAIWQSNDWKRCRFRTHFFRNNSGMFKAKRSVTKSAPGQSFGHVFVGVFELRSSRWQSVRFCRTPSNPCVECFHPARFPASPHQSTDFHAWALPQSAARRRLMIPSSREIM